MKLIARLKPTRRVRSSCDEVARTVQQRDHDVIAMRGSVEFHDERIELEFPEGKLVGLWEGPAGLDGDSMVAAVRHAVEHPLDFPPVRQAVVPGDRVAIALDSSLAGVRPVLDLILEQLQQSGVEPTDVTVVLTPGQGGAWLMSCRGDFR